MVVVGWWVNLLTQGWGVGAVAALWIAGMALSLVTLTAVESAKLAQRLLADFVRPGMTASPGGGQGSASGDRHPTSVDRCSPDVVQDGVSGDGRVHHG